MSDVERCESSRTARMAASMPFVTSGVVGVLKFARRPRVSVCCCEVSMATASVFVPIWHKRSEQRSQIRKAASTSYVDADADASEVCVRNHIVSSGVSELFEAACYHQSCSVSKQGQIIIDTPNSFEQQLHRPPGDMLSA
jgi:hypothetical protein